MFRGAIGCCEELLDEVKQRRFPAPPKDLSPHEAFRRFGSDEWDELRVRYRESAAPVKIAKAG